MSLPFADKVHLHADDGTVVLPAAKVWTDPCPEDPDEQLAFFQEYGFCILRGVLNADQLAVLDAEVQRFAENYQTIQSVREGFNVEDPSRWPSPDQPVFRKIGGQFDYSEAFAELCREPRIMAFMTRLYGPVIQLYRDVLMMKQARVGREKPWHQDAVYWPYRPMEQASVLTALDPADQTNGGLQIIPGSHKWGSLPHHGGELQVTLTPEQQAQTCYAPLAPGDSLIFHSLLLHGSEPNTSDRHRRVCIFSYMSPNFTYIGQGTPRPAPLVYDANANT